MSDKQSLQILNRSSYIGMIIALPFIFVSFLAYALLSLRHGHAKALLCYLASFFSVYLLYVIINYIPDNQHVSSSLCSSLVIILIYFIFAKYFWMNIICFDGWRNIGDSAGYFEPVSLEKRQMFWLYSVYAWGFPLLLTLLIFGVSKSVTGNFWYNPGLSDEECWLNDGVPIFMYVYLPLSITILADIGFLLAVARKFSENEEYDQRTNRKKIKEKFTAYLQLFSVLFCIWIMEIVTWAIIWINGYAPDGFWYFMEVFNALTGIVTFMICIFKKILRVLLLRRFHELRHNWRRKYHMEPLKREDVFTNG